MKTPTVKFTLQEGFSLVQGLVLTAVISGAAIIGTQQIQDQKTVQKRSQVKGEIGLLHDTIYSTLQNRDHCSGTLNLPANNVGGFAKTLVSITSKDGNGLFTVNPDGLKDPNKTYMNGNIAIKRMFIRDTATEGLVDLVIDYNRFKAVTPNQIPKESIIREKIQLKIQKDPKNNEFVGCYAVKNYAGDSESDEKLGNTNSLKNFCESLGSLVTWNEQFQTCSIKKNVCNDSQKLFIGINEEGQAICKSIFDHMAFTDLIDPSPVLCNPPSAASVKFVEAGERVKVDCGSSAYTPPEVIHDDKGGCTPVSGNWSDVSWSSCTTGPNPVKTATRACNNPEPSCNGADCTGDKTYTESCSCTPDKTCAQIEAGTCLNQEAGKDSCGNICSTGSLVCKKDCVPTKSCSELKGEVCVGKDVGFDSCDNDCGKGDLKTKECVICTPKVTCKELEKDTCSNETPVDSCGTKCDQGQKDCKKENKIKCEAQWCHLGKINNATCFIDGTYKRGGDGGQCDGEDSGRVPCDDSKLCGGAGIKVCTSCDEIRSKICTTNDAGKNSCGTSCGNGTKTCNQRQKKCQYQYNYNSCINSANQEAVYEKSNCSNYSECSAGYGTKYFYNVDYFAGGSCSTETQTEELKGCE